MDYNLKKLSKFMSVSKKLLIALLVTMLMSLSSGCEKAEVINYTKIPQACEEMKEWLSKQNKENPMPICGVIWIKQLGDKNEADE